MSVATAPSTAALHLALPPEPVLPLTVPQYHAIIRAGVLESGAPLELLEDQILYSRTTSGGAGA